MRKFSQLPPPGTPPPAGLSPGAPPGAPPAPDPLAGLGGLGSPTLTPPGAPAPEAPTGSPTLTPPVFKGLTSPEDVINDFNRQSALSEDFDHDQLANQIWQLYGGDSLGIDALPGKVGTWPEFPDEGAKPEYIEAKYKSTEKPSLRHKRLAEGYTIKDIFDNEEEIKRLITYTVETMQKKPKSYLEMGFLF